MPPRTHLISIDPWKPLADQPEVGHNRWHEDIPPVVEVDPGDRVVIETIDAFDTQVTPVLTSEECGALNLGPVHPLTGPVFIKGAEPGDLLEMKLLDIEADPFGNHGYTAEVPGFGFLRDRFTEPWIAHWHLVDGYAESEQIPGVRVRYGAHPGVIGLAPSKELRERATAREARLAEQGGVALPPDPDGAIPGGTVGEQGWRTVPPRETAGNIDIKQITPGCSVLLPVYAEGALFSTGDVHFAQGDCEACGTAIEMRSRVHVEFKVHKGDAERRNIQSLQFFRDTFFNDPDLAAPKRFYATTGFSVTPEGENTSEDLTLAARNALTAMIAYLETRGYDEQQAYALCSVAVDLRVSQVVDVPNFIVSALLPLDIFM
ncbi:MAG TPA: acetamidase/formamidase family protein [Thermomicrobiales bacterium]|nr:acetamidase/formamidase family protein [Thermomicrobiales bacterium]